MQEMIDKYDPSKNSRDDNKKNKRHAGVLAQAKRRNTHPSKLALTPTFHPHPHPHPNPHHSPLTLTTHHSPLTTQAPHPNQAKQRDKQLSKMEEEGLIADPDAKSDEATIALSFPPPPPLKKPLLASLDGASFRYPTPKGILAKGAPLLRELRVSVSLGERIGVLGRRSRVAEGGRGWQRVAEGSRGWQGRSAREREREREREAGPTARGPPPTARTPLSPPPLSHVTGPRQGQHEGSTPARHGRSPHRPCASRAALVPPRPNGAGKSTLLHLLTQQLQPTSGEAWLNRGAKWAIFAQHHIDQLDLNSSPQDFLASKFAGAPPHRVHARRMHAACTLRAQRMYAACTPHARRVHRRQGG